MSVVMNFLISSMPVFKVWLSENLDKIESRFFLNSNKDSYGIKALEGVAVNLDIKINLYIISFIIIILFM